MLCKAVLLQYSRTAFLFSISLDINNECRYTFVINFYKLSTKVARENIIWIP